MNHWASLSMYDFFPELREANDALWYAIADLMRSEGVDDVPPSLCDGALPQAGLSNDAVLFTQICGYPLRTRFRGQFLVLGVPCYDVPGCSGPTHRAFIVVAKDSPARAIDDLKDATFAVNAFDSNTGMNLPRYAFAPLARSQPFFSAILVTGSHAASMDAVAGGAADAASIDCVTYGLCERYRPSVTARLRILDVTASSPSLPFVTSVALSPHTDRMRSALARLSNDAHLSKALRPLGISRIVAIPQEAYDVNLVYQFEAHKLGYAHLH